MRLLRRFRGVCAIDFWYVPRLGVFPVKSLRQRIYCRSDRSAAPSLSKVCVLEALGTGTGPECVSWARGQKRRPLAAQPEHSCVRLFSGRSWLVGVSDAPRKLRGRLHRLTGAAQAPVKRLFGLLKVVFALYLGCCQKTKPAWVPLLKNRAKLSPRALALHASAPGKVTTSARPLRTESPARGTRVLQRSRPHRRMLCARPWAAAPTRVRRWSSLLVVSRVRRGGANTQVPRNACVRTRGVLTNTCRHTAVC